MRVLACRCECVWEYALMANLEAADIRLSFDDILEAVQDSKRGRWFLQEFETRLQKRDTTSLLSAMARLESRMGELSTTSGKAENLGVVSAAIAKARDDLLKLGLGKEAMSNEGRMFADLADLARKAMPDTAEGRAGIVRALQLAEEIDKAVAPAANADSGAKYFQPDAELFERKTLPTKPTLVAVPEPALDTNTPAKQQPITRPATGAKLMIRRVGESSDAPPIAATPVVESPKPEPEPVVYETPTLERPAIDNPRIVIIRRKAEDMPDVTMSEATESAA
jgi:hypothetical protein